MEEQPISEAFVNNLCRHADEQTDQGGMQVYKM